VNHGAESGHRPRGVDEPLPTLTARANQYLVEPFILGQQSNSAPRSVDQPVPTIATAGKIAMVESFVLGQQTGSVARSTNQPLPTLSTDGAIALVEPFLVPMYGERPTQEPRTHSVDEPVPTIPASGGGKFGVVQPFIVDAAHGNDAKSGSPSSRTRSLDEPLGTVTGSNRFAVAEPFIVQTSHGQRLHDIDNPLPTVTTARCGDFAVAEPFITKYNGTAKTAQSVADPLDTISTRDRFGLVQPVIDGYVLDIRFRMLQPHELAAATSFPKEYQFVGKKEDVVKQIGNAWPGELAKALCAEVITPYASRKRRTNRKECVA
jgi:DNA (cytosine-5)-methyltransferase 1